jgi:alkylhydroperoxidase family enzyme
LPRLRQVPRGEVTDDLVRSMYDHLFGERDPVAQPGTASGSPGDWWTVFALSPDVFRHAVDGFVLYQTRSLDPVLRELAQTRAGWQGGSQFVFSQHCKSCRSLGIPDEKIDAIRYWAVSDLFTTAERAVLAYADALTVDRGRVADEVVESLHRYLTDVEILELTYVTALYGMHATMANALRVEFDDVPDRVVEVAAPEGSEARDIGSDIAGPAAR